MQKAAIWYLAHPTDQYVEDVKALAKAAGVRIVDANVTADREGAAETVPEVTLRNPPAPSEAELSPELKAAQDAAAALAAPKAPKGK